MSANVESMFSVREKPWHGIGTVVEEHLTAEEALVTAGLDWEVSKSPIYYQRNGGMEVVKDKFAMVRSDNGEQVGVVGKKYTPLQNADALSFMDAIIGTKEALYETAGSLGRGEKVWMMAKVDGVMRVAGTDDTIEKYLLVSNTHNGTSPVNVALTSVRVVCQNTLAWALGEAKQANKLFKVRHTRSVGDKVAEAREQLQIVNSWFADFNEAVNALAKVEATKEVRNAFLKGVGLDPEATKGREKAQVDKVLELFEVGAGNTAKGVKGTLWALTNGLTEYVDHYRSTRQTGTFATKDEARLASAWFGSGNSLKEKALETALSLT